MTTQTNPDDTTITFAYDSADNQTSITDERSKVTTLAFDKLDWRTSVTDRESAVTSYDPRGYVISYTFNARGLAATTSLPDPDGNGPQARAFTINTYDDMGRLLEVTDHLLSTTKYEYDSRSRVTKLTQPDVIGGPADSQPKYGDRTAGQAHCGWSRHLRR